MKELERLDMIPKDWSRLLKCLLNNHKQPTTVNDQNSRGEKRDEEKEEESKGEENQETQSQKCADQDWQLLSPDSYFWVVVSKDNLANSLCYQPSQFMSKYIDKKLKSEVIYLEIHKLQYLTLLSLSLIHRIKNIYHYHERIIENSTFSNHGFWMFNPENSLYGKFIKDKRWLTYVDEVEEGPDAYDLLRIKKIFEFHETNFLSCIDLETIATIIQTNGKSASIK